MEKERTILVERYESTGNIYRLTTDHGVCWLYKNDKLIGLISLRELVERISAGADLLGPTTEGLRTSK